VIGDGANDISMFEAAGFSIAFNASPILYNIADVVIMQKDLTMILPIFKRGVHAERIAEKKALLKKEADVSKLERNRLNAEASQFATRRDELNTKTRALIDSAQQAKDKRDEFNKLVSENKEKRDTLNEQANNLLAKADQIKRKFRVSGGLSLSELKREIDHLEFKQQTEVVSTEKERELVDHIAHLWEEYRKKREEL